MILIVNLGNSYFFIAAFSATDNIAYVSFGFLFLYMALEAGFRWVGW